MAPKVVVKRSYNAECAPSKHAEICDCVYVGMYIIQSMFCLLVCGRPPVPQLSPLFFFDLGLLMAIVPVGFKRDNGH